MAHAAPQDAKKLKRGRRWDKDRTSITKCYMTTGIISYVGSLLVSVM